EPKWNPRTREFGEQLRYSVTGVEIEGPIGVNISALEAAGVNLTALAEKLRNDTEVDDILSRTNASIK
ncbi:unnamed protein product, partial [Heligmosomoides polygyrus]|uniref:Transcription termination/antitermination protein NusA n=1 Tax=Heligmosomoides polygyrus TaxID=6339 RepID=A0A183GFV6_HELPZ